MSINEMESKARELRELQALIDEATAEAEALKDALKAAMASFYGKENNGQIKKMRELPAILINAAVLKPGKPNR